MPPRSASSPALCPECGARGAPAPSVTIASLVRPEALAALATTEGFRFCASVECGTVYFHPETGETVARSGMRIRVGQKERGPDRTLCYCFGYKAGEVQGRAAAGEGSTILRDIGEKCARGLDRCPETNPRGACCLGEVKAAIEEARRRLAGSPSSNLPGHQDECPSPSRGSFPATPNWKRRKEERS